MANFGEEKGLLGTGRFLSKHWKDPGSVYPAVPGLLTDTAFPSPVELIDKDDRAKLAWNFKSKVPTLAQVQYEVYKLQQGDGPPVSKRDRERALAAAKEYLDTVKSNFLGYQVNFANSYSHLSHYLDTHVNNVGDPFNTGNLMSQTKFMERAVLDYFAALWNADWPHDRYREKATEHHVDPQPEKPDSYWGFVLSMGCTEGTLYGMWNGRDYLAGKVMLMDDDFGGDEGAGAKYVTRPTPMYVIAECEEDTYRTKTDGDADCRLTPICFFSEDAHYSLQKAMVILNIRTFYAEAIEKKYPCPLGGSWPKKVPSNLDGTVNVDALVKLVAFFAEKGYPPLICFNFGTTFKGSYDDIEGASQRLIPILDEYGLMERTLHVKVKDGRTIDVKRYGFWFHVDGALGAAYIPFLRMAQGFDLYPEDSDKHKIPKFDFSLRGPESVPGKDYSKVEVVQSIAMSGHKWIGAPVPTGLYMTKSKFQLMPPEIPSYIGTPDTTFAGSRSGLSSVILWDHLARHSFNQLMEKAVYTQNMAKYLQGQLQKLNDLVKGKRLHPDLKPNDLWVHDLSKLSLSVIFRQPNDEIVRKYSLSKETEDGRPLVHAYAMEHVTLDTIDELIQDLSEEGAFDSFHDK